MARLVAGVREDQLTDPTPCSEYAVGDLVEHVGGLTQAFTACATKTSLPAQDNPKGDASRLEEGWRDRIVRDLGGLAAAWRDPSAYEGEATAGGITLPAFVMASVALDELVVHGWDLATATGQPYDVSEADVAASLQFMEPFATQGPADREGTGFGPAVDVPADAPALHRLLALTGRRPSG